MAKKKFDYFDYFKRVSEIICEASVHLHDTLHSFNPETLKEELDTMHQIEHKADDIRHEMMRYLTHEFITPIEPEDIVTLAQSLDTVVDSMEDVLLRMYMFDAKTVRNEAVKFADLITQCSKELDIVCLEFKNFKKSESIKEHIVAVNNSESEGDALLVSAMRRLSVSDTTDRELFVWTDIFEHLELVLDACEDVTDIIETVVMKNS